MKGVMATPILLDPANQPKFINPFRNALENAATPTHDKKYKIGIYDPSTGKPFLTTVWAYG